MFRDNAFRPGRCVNIWHLSWIFSTLQTRQPSKKVKRCRSTQSCILFSAKVKHVHWESISRFSLSENRTLALAPHCIYSFPSAASSIVNIVVPQSESVSSRQYLCVYTTLQIHKHTEPWHHRSKSGRQLFLSSQSKIEFSLGRVDTRWYFHLNTLQKSAIRDTNKKNKNLNSVSL